MKTCNNCLIDCIWCSQWMQHCLHSLITDEADHLRRRHQHHRQNLNLVCFRVYRRWLWVDGWRMDVRQDEDAMPSTNAI
jgi:hypothetical protein